MSRVCEAANRAAVEIARRDLVARIPEIFLVPDEFEGEGRCARLSAQEVTADLADEIPF